MNSVVVNSVTGSSPFCSRMCVTRFLVIVLTITLYLMADDLRYFKSLIAYVSGNHTKLLHTNRHGGGGLSPPKFHFMIRSFQGDEERFHKVLFPTLEAFLIFELLDSFTIILDNESERDHAFGQRILDAANMKGFPIQVKYADPPPDEILRATPFRVSDNVRAKTPGYTRQLYDTYWFDQYAPSSADIDNDIIIISDMDAPLVSVLNFKELVVYNESVTTIKTSSSFVQNPFSSFFTSVPESLSAQDKFTIYHPANLPDMWKGDAYVLTKDGSKGSIVTFDIMGVNVMPQLVWMNTFAKCRQYITTLWSPEKPSFEQAWLNLYGQADAPIETLNKLGTSPVNVLINYGYYYQQTRSDNALYAMNIVNPTSTVALPAFSMNKGSKKNVILGCCRVFSPERLYYDELSLPYCKPAQYYNSEHITATSVGTWSEIGRDIIADKVYNEISSLLMSIPEERYLQMKRKCGEVRQWTAKWK